MRKLAAGLGLVGALVCGALLAVRASPEPGGRTRLAAGKTFAPICDANGDTRPDPAWVGASFADDHCWAPRMPAALDGYTVSREKLLAGMAAVKSYEADSGSYERCIRDFVAARRGVSGRRMDVALVIIENHRIAASVRKPQEGCRANRNGDQ